MHLALPQGSGQPKHWHSPCYCAQLAGPREAAHRVLLVHVNLRRQHSHGRAAARALAGTCPEVRLAGIGTVLLQGASAVVHRVTAAPRRLHLLPPLSALPQALPCLQGAPATVGISSAHAVPTGGIHLTRCHLHSGHLEAETGSSSVGQAAPSPGWQCPWGLGNLRPNTGTE